MAAAHPCKRAVLIQTYLADRVIPSTGDDIISTQSHPTRQEREITLDRETLDRIEHRPKKRGWEMSELKEQLFLKPQAPYLDLNGSILILLSLGRRQGGR